MGPLDLVAEAFDGFVVGRSVMVLDFKFTGDPKFEPEVKLSVSPRRSGWSTVALPVRSAE